MKTRFLFGMLFYCVLFTFAQTPSDDGRLWVGAEAGIGQRALIGSDYIENQTESSIGFLLGLHVQRNITDILALRAHALIQRKGAALSDTTENLALTYFKVPILLRVHLGKPIKTSFGHLGFFLQAGPYGAIEYIEESDLITEEFDLGLMGSAGGFVRFGRLAISLEGRYSRGTRPIGALRDLEGFQVYNQAMNGVIGLSYLFKTQGGFLPD